MRHDLASIDRWLKGCIKRCSGKEGKRETIVTDDDVICGSVLDSVDTTSVEIRIAVIVGIQAFAFDDVAPVETLTFAQIKRVLAGLFLIVEIFDRDFSIPGDEISTEKQIKDLCRTAGSRAWLISGVCERIRDESIPNTALETIGTLAGWISTLELDW